jgi:TonB family protein
MAYHADILDERDPIGWPFLGAIVVHVGVVVLIYSGWFWMNRHRDTFGELHPAGGPAYAVSAVRTIPIPQNSAPPNPVASDSQSMVPAAPAKQEAQRQTPPPDKNAVAIPDKFRREQPQPTHPQQYRQPAPPNQIYTQSRPAVSNPMYSAAAGAGQVGVGPNTPLGNNRLGWYAELIRQRIAQNWNTNGLDGRLQNSPTVITFTIMRDGTIRDPKVTQSSGNYNIDNTALRAVFQSSPLPQLPPQVTESSITAQFTFNLR